MTEDALPAPSELVEPAEQVLEEDLETWVQQLGPERRQETYEEIDENWRTYRFEGSALEDQHPQEYRGRDNELDRQKLRAAKVYLVAANRRDPHSDVTLNERLSEDTVAFVEEFNDYRSFDVVDSETLQDEIRDDSSELYGFVESNIESLIEQRQSLVDTESHDIASDEVAYFVAELRRRREFAQEAATEFIKVHGLPNTIEGIVQAANATSDAAVTREEVHEELQSELETVASELQSDTTDRERALLARLDRLEAKLEADAADATDLDALAEEIASHREGRVADLDALDAHVERVEQLDATLEDTIESLQAEASTGQSDVAETVVEEELTRLREQRGHVAEQLRDLKREREKIATATERLARENEVVQSRAGTGDGEETARTDEPSGQAVDSGAGAGAEAVSSSRARLYERNFLNRFEADVEDLARSASRVGELAPFDGDFRVRKLRAGSRETRLEELVSEADETDDHYPVGAFSQYVVQTPVLAGWRWNDELLLEAVFHANFYAYTADGAERSPAGISDLLEEVDRAVERADRSGVPRVLGVASPTGWTDEVVREVSDEERTHVGEDVQLCLVDLQDGSLVYDERNRQVDALTTVFERTVDDDRVQEAAGTIRSQYLEAGDLSRVPLGQVVEEQDLAADVVESAFLRLSETADVRQDHDENGPVLQLE